MPRTLEPFPVVSVAPDKLTVDENEIHDTVTIHRASPAPTRLHGSSTTQLKTAKHSHKRDLPDTECSQPQPPKKYAANRVVRPKVPEERSVTKSNVTDTTPER